MTADAHFNETGHKEFAMNIQKYQYGDVDFDAEDAKRSMPSFGPGELEAARRESEDAGRAAGIQEAQATIEADAARILPVIMARVEALAAEQEERRETICNEAVRLASAIARKVLPGFAASKTYEEVQAFMIACFKERHEEARVVVRLPDALLDPIQARLDTLIRESGFSGRTTLLADPAMGPLEARVEWANGGADWNFERQLGDIEETARRLASIKPLAVPPARAGLPRKDFKETTT